jgi:hypothetical protein
MKSRRLAILMIALLLVLSIGCDRSGSKFERLPGNTNVEVRVAPERKLVEPAPQLVSMAEAFRGRFPTASVTWNPYTGYAKQLSGFVFKAAPDVRDAQTAARNFIQEYAALLGPSRTESSLQLVNVTEAGSVRGDSVNRRFVRFRQVVEKAPVFQGEIVVHLTAANSIYAIYNSYQPITSVVGGMKIGSAQALDRARQLLKEKPKSGSYEAIEPVIYPYGSDGIRAWRVVIDHWLVILRGDTGETLLLRDEARYGPDALVYLENPVQTSDPAVRTLTNLGAATTLCGIRFCVHNQTGQTIMSTQQEFRDPPSDANFDDQMAYYHMETIASRFNQLGVTGPGGTLPKGINTNDNTLPCNAFYNPPDDCFYFSPAGSGCDGNCRSSAQYADIIYHEFTHRLLDEEVGLIYDDTESGSIHEGTADFYSASLLGNPCMAEKWSEEKACTRDASVFRGYPKDMDDEPHAGGEVWASALWTFRGNVGKETAERMAREGLRGLPADADFSTFAANIVVQGVAYYGSFLGDNAWENFFILLGMFAAAEGAKSAFCSHGIAVSYGPFTDLTLTTPPADTRNTWSVSVPAGTVIDIDRGCNKGYDLVAPGGWKDLKFFYDKQSELKEYTVDMSGTTLTVTMRTPGGCGSIDRVNLTYRVYYKKSE